MSSETVKSIRRAVDRWQRDGAKVVILPYGNGETREFFTAQELMKLLDCICEELEYLG